MRETHTRISAPPRWHSLHLFVTSTFNDMHAERDHLRHVVFPALAGRLRTRRVHLEVVDLRLGVDTLSIDDEAEREREVLRYCLDEVYRCRPFQLVLLGDRYGHVPDEARLAGAARRLGRDVEQLRGRSVTELEIEAGLVEGVGVAAGLRVFLRQPLDPATLPADRVGEFSDRAAGRDAAAAALDALRGRLRDLAPRRCRDYALAWDPAARRFSGLHAFGETVAEALWSDFDRHTADAGAIGHEPTTPEARHRSEAADFIEIRRTTFVGRETLLDDLDAFCRGAGGAAAALLLGPSGAGKSSVLAALAARLAEGGADAPLVLAHFFGNTAAAGSVDAVLRRFAEDLAATAGESAVAPADGDDPERLAESFAWLLSRAAGQRRVILLLDALDRLEPTAEARAMRWLPARLPTNVRLLATAVEGEESRAFAARTGADPTTLPGFSEREARAMVRRLCEHRTLNQPVVDRLLAVPGPDGEPAARNPLWLSLATGQLNRLEGDAFLLVGARLERLADARLAGYLADWAARLPGEPQTLFTAVLRAAEGHYGVDSVRLARVLAAGRQGWRESDLLGILARITGDDWQPLALARLRYALYGALAAGTEGLWRFAHGSLAAAAALHGDAGFETADLHAAVVAHLLALPAEDPLRRSELAHHALAADDHYNAALALTCDDADDDDASAIEALIDELLAKPAGAGRPFEWVRKLLWAEGVRGGRRLRLAARLDEAAHKLAHRHRWSAASAVFALLVEFHRGTAERLVDRSEADFQVARATFGVARCARAEGDPKTAVKRQIDSANLMMALIQGTAHREQFDSAAAIARSGSDGQHVFRRRPTLARMAECYDLAHASQCEVAELLMELGKTHRANWLIAGMRNFEHFGPPPLVAALRRELPLRESGQIALTSGWEGLYWLHRGSGVGASGSFNMARWHLKKILSFVPTSTVLRRELAVIEARTSQAVLLADAPAAAVHRAGNALNRIDALCREEPAVAAHQLDRAFALRCLADGWEGLGDAATARVARALAARDLRLVIDPDIGDEKLRRALAWAGEQSATDQSVAELVGRRPPAWDYEHPSSWSGDQSEAEVARRDPDALAVWRARVLEGPRFGDWLTALSSPTTPRAAPSNSTATRH